MELYPDNAEDLFRATLLVGIHFLLLENVITLATICSQTPTDDV